MAEPCSKKKGVGTRRLKYCSPLVTPNLTRLLHNTASYAGYRVFKFQQGIGADTGGGAAGSRYPEMFVVLLTVGSVFLAS